MKHGRTFLLLVSVLSGVTAAVGLSSHGPIITYVKAEQSEEAGIEAAEANQAEETTITSPQSTSTSENVSALTTDTNSESKAKATGTTAVREEGKEDTPEKVLETGSKASVENTAVRLVPFYSQFNDISTPSWRKVGCGIASLAMLIDYYLPGTVTVDKLLDEGIAAGAYSSDGGWSHAGLIGVARAHGLDGEAVYLTDSSVEEAVKGLEAALKEGPVIASVHYTFKPTNPIPHLVVITDIKDGMVHYNDPAEAKGDGKISIKDFEAGWKQRFIQIRPAS